VDARKRRQVARLAEIWLSVRPWALRGVRDVRFDIVAVDATARPPAVRHLAGAFTLDG
jgi:Holliday junction resolvase-like predicted endonuclease